MTRLRQRRQQSTHRGRLAPVPTILSSWLLLLLCFVFALSIICPTRVQAATTSNPAPRAGSGTTTTTAAAPTSRPMDSDFTPCKTCIYVLEQIKANPQTPLPAICSQVYLKFPESYSDCHQVLNSLAVNSPNVRQWLLGGCYKQEVYGAKSWISPCPSHVICGALKNLQSLSYCPILPTQDPFAVSP